MMVTMDSQLERVKKELTAVGVTSYGQRLPEVKALAHILHSDEHIGGVVYGKYPNGLAWLVATQKRVIFLDHKPMFNTLDEITYDVVSGVQSSKAGPLVSVTLFTRINNYSISFVNAKCAQIFVNYIEKRRLTVENTQQPANHDLDYKQLPDIQTNNNEALKFLQEHELAVLSTVDRTGNVHGAVIYYYVDKPGFIYILTKSETGKGRNVYAHGQVAMTLHEAGTLQTLQVQGLAEIETDQTKKEEVFAAIVKQRTYRDGASLPPVVKLHEGSFTVIRIAPTLLSFHDYSKIQ